MDTSPPPGIFKALRQRFFIFRLLTILIPLVFCLVFSLVLGFFIVNFYVDAHGEDFSRTTGIPAEIFESQFLFLVIMGIILICSLTALLFLIHGAVRKIQIRMIEKPPDEIFRGLKKLQINQRGVTIKNVAGPFNSLYKCFNETATTLETNHGENQAEAALNRLDHCLEEFLAALNTDPEKQKKYFDKARKKIADIRKYTGELLLLFALEKAEVPAEAPNEFPMSGGVLEPGRFLEDLVRELSEKYRKAGLTVALDADYPADAYSAENPREMKIFADALWLKDAVTRLLENALNSKRLERGTAVLGLRRRKKNPLNDDPLPEIELAEIIVASNGQGFSEENLPVLFDRPGFFRSEPFPGEGNGLPLALAARIVKHLGGSIYAERPARGSLSAVICFPLTG